MEIFACIEFLILLAIFFLAIILGYSRKTSPELPWNLPIVGMIPTFLTNIHQIYDKIAEILESRGGTFKFRGAWFTNMDIMMTSDPANVQHVTSTNFGLYPKGMPWRKRFDIFGSTIFNSDFDEWKNQKVFIRGYLSHQKFQELLTKIFEDSMKNRLIPSLQHFSQQQVPFDLSDLLKRHIYYIASRLVSGSEASSFPLIFNETLFCNSISSACEAIFDRHILPESFCKLQKWLKIGKEGKLSDAWRAIDRVLDELVFLKKKEVGDRKEEEDIDFSLLELHLIKHKLLENVYISNNVIRDNMLSFMFAFQDSTSTVLGWFFWLLLKHPIVEKKIREEIREYFPQNGSEIKWLAYGARELSKMVYLHAALCETLRLYPPVPFESRTCVKNDTLPSGHMIKQGQNILICTYAMGRMTSVWGEDCHEFKPERWITRDGGVRHEPANKFFAFNGGPRICLGKDIAFNLMKATASAIIHNYHIKVVEKHPVKPKTSIIL